jgi:hypothetical protein
MGGSANLSPGNGGSLPNLWSSESYPVRPGTDSRAVDRYGLPLHPEIRDQASALLPPGHVLYDLAYRPCRYCFQDRTLEQHPRS